ncbi:MAG: VWA domain-containing protein [Pseudomonadota bacterium]
MSGVDLFQFLRPAWLLAVPALLLLWWLLRRRDAAATTAFGPIAPHLASALVVNAGARSGPRPVDAGILAGLLVAVAAAGPTWSRQPSPWFSETAPLVIAVEVSDSMRANDLQPTRLDRARFKIQGLVAARTGARTALIAYSGTAHIVMPPTTDAAVLGPFLESLDPRMMPQPGANAAAVLPLATEMLGAERTIGSILFVNDGFDSTDIPALTEHAATPGTPGLVSLVVGTDAGGVALLPDGSQARSADGSAVDTRIDAALLRRAGDAGAMPVIRADVGDADIRRVLAAVESQLRLADDPDARWRDEGWWFLWPAGALLLLAFRRGWTMQW